MLGWNNYMLATRFVPPPRAPFLRARDWEEKELQQLLAKAKVATSVVDMLSIITLRAVLFLKM